MTVKESFHRTLCSFISSHYGCGGILPHSLRFIGICFCTGLLRSHHSVSIRLRYGPDWHIAKPWFLDCKIKGPFTAVLDTWYEVIVCCVWFFPDMVLCVLAKRLHFVHPSKWHRSRSLVVCSNFGHQSCAPIFFLERSGFLLATLPNMPYLPSLFLTLLSWNKTCKLRYGVWDVALFSRNHSLGWNFWNVPS